MTDSPSPLTERMPRVDELTGMRWWAAFYVFGYHMLVFAPLPGIASAVLEYGYIGVTFFFVLSGFVLTWSRSPRVSQSTFYWRRFARIYPSHFVALLLAIPVFTSFAPDPDQWWVHAFNPVIILLSFLLLQGWSRDPGILFSGNPAAWTLTCEMFFYAMHPYLSRLLDRLRTRGALVFVGVVIAVAFVYRAAALVWPTEWWAAGMPWPIVRLTEFAIGMGLAWAFRSGWRPRVPVTLGVGALIATILALTAARVLLPGSTAVGVVAGFSNEIITVACALAIVALAARRLSGRRSVFASRLMVVLGEWSYAFYLVHATFIYLALTWLGPQEVGWSNLVWFAVVFVIALAGAAALHYLVERPFERWLRAWKDRRDAARVATRAEADAVVVEPAQTK